jgi:cytochrome c biogenesis protein CcdA/glutaredoxin
MDRSLDELAVRRRGTFAPSARRLVFIVMAALSIALAAPAALEARAAPPPPDPVEVVLFWGDGCPHCETAKEFLEELRRDHPDLVVREYEVWGDAANLQLFVETAAAAGVDPQAVPTTFIGNRVWIGFSSATADEIRAVVEAAMLGEAVAFRRKSRLVDVPIVGEIDVGGRSLLLSSLIIGFVDGVNPCSLWVLSILLALVLHSGSRRRVAVVGAVFLIVTSAMYGLYIVGAYSALSYAQFLPWIQRSVALVAIVLGLLQLKDGFGIAAGPSLGVSEHARPAMYQRMRGLAVGDRPLPALLGATVALAVGVSLLETPCTLGLPILWTNLLAENDVAFAGAAVLFVAYLSMFLLDELIVFVTVVATMRALKVQERHGQALKIVSGMVMITLAVVLLVVARSDGDRHRHPRRVRDSAAVLSVVAITAQQFLTSRGETHSIQ